MLQENKIKRPNIFSNCRDCLVAASVLRDQFEKTGSRSINLDCIRLTFDIGPYRLVDQMVMEIETIIDSSVSPRDRKVIQRVKDAEEKAYRLLGEGFEKFSRIVWNERKNVTEKCPGLEEERRKRKD
jgi:hypothetical protein